MSVDLSIHDFDNVEISNEIHLNTHLLSEIKRQFWFTITK